MTQLRESNRKRRERNNGRNNMGIAWIPAHMGIEGNERADRKAKDKTEEQEQIQIKTPEEDLVREEEQEAWKKSRERNQEEGNWKGIKYFTSGLSNNERRIPWFTGIANLERGSINTLSRTRANHYNLNESLERKGIITLSQCECGEMIQDIDHYIWECTEREEDRERMRRRMEKRGIRRGEPITNILKSKRQVDLRLIATFIHKMGRTV